MKTKWLKRSDEWIKSNPGKPTMYKVFIDENGHRAGPAPVSQIIETPKYKENRGVYVIMCEPAKRAYVGQSENIPSRLRSHKMFIMSDSDKCEASYVKMREDRRKYGIESFKFTKYLSVLHGGTNDLLRIENEAMIEFMEKGYELYNKHVVSRNIYCPESIKTHISKIIAIMQADFNASAEFEALINKHNHLIKEYMQEA